MLIAANASVQISSHVFVMFATQICSRLAASESGPFQDALKPVRLILPLLFTSHIYLLLRLVICSCSHCSPWQLVLRMAVEHPHHVLWQLLSIAWQERGTSASAGTASQPALQAEQDRRRAAEGTLHLSPSV